MGVDTNGYLKPEITATDIYNAILSKFDKEAEFDVHQDRSDGGEIGRIHFNYNGEDRSVFYCIVPDKIDNTEFDDGRNHVTLSLRCWGSSVEIMTEIVKCFGGYIDANDCDNEDAFYVPKDGEFQYDNHMVKRNRIIDVLDKGLNQSVKIQIANQILKHWDELKELL